ncbi:MAG: sialate O-acetylesterase [Pseudomonadota bacterium]
MDLTIGIGIASGGLQGSGTPPTHVFGLAGQSNMQGGPTFDGGDGYPGGTLQFGRRGGNNLKIIPALGNLHHDGGYGSNKMSLAFQFAIDYIAANPGVRVLFVPGAKGGSTYISNDWNKGDPSYEDFVLRMNMVFDENPGFALKGVLWQHGETDGDNAGGPTYAANLDQMIADFRTDITRAGPTTPVLVGEIAPALADDSASHTAVFNAQTDVASRVLHTAVVSSADLTTYDRLHFNAASLRTLGGRYFTALSAAVANDGSGANLVRDGGMDDPAQWVLGDGATVAGGVGRTISNKAYWRQTGVPLVAGKTYNVTWTVSNYTTGTTTPFFLGGSNVNGSNTPGAGTHTQQLVAGAGNDRFQLNAGGGSTLSVDDISIIEA